MSVSIGKSLKGFTIGRCRLIKSETYVKRNLFDRSPKEEKLVQVEVEDAKLITEEEKEMAIEKIRNKSRLKRQHRNILFNLKPYSEPMIEDHLTIKYNRKMYGRYGSESGVNPGIMWPTKKDIEERREYEKIAYPLTIQELVAAAKNDKEMRELKQQQIHDRVVSNWAKLEAWKAELKKKLAKAEADAVAAKQRKERLIEEVRRHFGYTVDPRDEKFKEMIAVKEKELRKKEKQAKFEKKEKKAIEELMAKHKSDSTGSN